MRFVFCVLFSFLMSNINAADPVAQWIFVPEYRLGQQAQNQPGPRIEHPRVSYPMVEVDTLPLRYNGELPTQRLQHLMPEEQIPRKSFSVEMWICHHVNTPVAAIAAARSVQPGSQIPWTFGFDNWETIFRLQADGGSEVQLRSKMKAYAGYKERWIHQVVSYDGHDLQMYVNGTQVASGHMHQEEIVWPEDTHLELAAYMKNEPYMQWANLVNALRIYDYPLSKSEVLQNFAELKASVEAGQLYPNLFHYTAGPYLNLATTDSMSLVWETDRPATARIEWGKTHKLGESAELKQPQRLQDFVINDLQPDTAYFYRVSSTDESTETIDSGLLTFKTAVEAGQAFRFSVLGDTEARPHINDQLAKLIWGERPHFIINLGDLTDAGKKPHRYEWTHEYFLGMTQLASRVPVFAVPGNGEDDLFWYKHYHRYPDPEGYYTFNYGDAAFFMLDSNQRQTDFLPGGIQYRWLEEQLKNCKSRWKFVCHHHATYTGEEDDYGDSWKESSQFGDEFVRQIVPLYEKYAVDMVMFGHLHIYERSRPIRNGKVDLENGVVHLLAGGGGGNLEDFAPTPAFFSAKTHRGHHYVTIEIAGDEMGLRMYDVEGNLKDFFTLKKSLPGQLSVSRPQ